MGRDVRAALIDLAQSYGKFSSEAASKYLQDLQNKGKYIQELWS